MEVSPHLLTADTPFFVVLQALQVQALGHSQPPHQGPALTLLSMYASVSSNTMGLQNDCGALTPSLTDPLRDHIQVPHLASDIKLCNSG